MAPPELTFSTRGEVGAWNESRGRVVGRERERDRVIMVSQNRQKPESSILDG